VSSRIRVDERDQRTASAATRLNQASGAIAASVLFDSAIEHYRGSFHNKAMVAPLAASAACLLAGAHGGADRRRRAHPLRDGAFATAAVVGLIGTGFHLFNIGKRPGGFSLENLFYAAPIGAPGALVLSGALGFLAERLRDARGEAGQSRIGLLAAATAVVGLLGAAGEAGLLHLRGAFQDPFMLVPVTVAPAGGAVLAAAAARPSRERGRLARWWLWLTGGIGVAGTGFHVYGVHRHMGGWRNWRQTVLAGPPVPAPSSFTGLALAGLAALDLLEPDE